MESVLLLSIGLPLMAALHHAELAKTLSGQREEDVRRNVSSAVELLEDAVQ